MKGHTFVTLKTVKRHLQILRLLHDTGMNQDHKKNKRKLNCLKDEFIQAKGITLATIALNRLSTKRF